MSLEDNLITSEKQKRKLEKEIKSKQKEIAKQEKKEKEREEREIKAKAKEEKKKEKLEKKSAARSNMKANSVQGQPCMEDFRYGKYLRHKREDLMLMINIAEPVMMIQYQCFYLGVFSS